MGDQAVELIKYNSISGEDAEPQVRVQEHISCLIRVYSIRSLTARKASLHARALRACATLCASSHERI